MPARKAKKRGSKKKKNQKNLDAQAKISRALEEVHKEIHAGNWTGPILERCERKARKEFRSEVPKDFPGRTSYIDVQMLKFRTRCEESLLFGIDDIDFDEEAKFILEEEDKSLNVTDSVARRLAKRYWKDSDNLFVEACQDDVWLFVSDSINPAIKKADSKKLHRIARDHNWDFGTTDLFHIVRHPKCARVTARMIYWRGSPVETLAKGAKLSAWGRETRSLLKEIERGMRSGTEVMDCTDFL
jgi:hypothetical protein